MAAATEVVELEVVAYPRPQLAKEKRLRFNALWTFNRPTLMEILIAMGFTVGMWVLIAPYRQMGSPEGTLWGITPLGFPVEYYIRNATPFVTRGFFAAGFVQVLMSSRLFRPQQIPVADFVRRSFNMLLVSVVMVGPIAAAWYTICNLTFQPGLGLPPILALALAAGFVVPLSLVQAYFGSAPILCLYDGLSVSGALGRAFHTTKKLRARSFATFLVANVTWAAAVALALYKLEWFGACALLAGVLLWNSQRAERVHQLLTGEAADTAIGWEMLWHKLTSQRKITQTVLDMKLPETAPLRNPEAPLEPALAEAIEVARQFH